MLIPEWKPTELLTVWEPRIRECVVGTPQKRLVDFVNSYASTVDPGTVKCIRSAYMLTFDPYKNAISQNGLCYGGSISLI